MALVSKKMMTIFQTILHLFQGTTLVIFCHTHHLLLHVVNIIHLCFRSLAKLLAVRHHSEISPSWYVFIQSITSQPSYSNHPGLHPRHQLPRRRPSNPRPNLPLRHLAHLHNPHRACTSPTTPQSRNKSVAADLRLESAG